jgi:hypothetical protein
LDLESPRNESRITGSRLQLRRSLSRAARMISDSERSRAESERSHSARSMPRLRIRYAYKKAPMIEAGDEAYLLSSQIWPNSALSDCAAIAASCRISGTDWSADGTSARSMIYRQPHGPFSSAKQRFALDASWLKSAGASPTNAFIVRTFWIGEHGVSFVLIECSALDEV